jgi:enamidase
MEPKIMRLAVTNIGTIVSGDWREPFVKGDTIVTSGSEIESVGSASANEVEACDVVIDADGATAVPGLIDSHVHITFGDYTPRQQTVGYLESYVQGGVTTAISASEVHVPGRPRDAEGVKALAVAARKCFDTYRPGGNLPRKPIGRTRARVPVASELSAELIRCSATAARFTAVFPP